MYIYIYIYIYIYVYIYIYIYIYIWGGAAVGKNENVQTEKIRDAIATVESVMLAFFVLILL